MTLDLLNSGLSKEELVLRSERTYVSKVPDSRMAVLLVSGLDSVTAWHFCVSGNGEDVESDGLGLKKVFPLFVDRAHSRAREMELESVSYFDRKIRRQFPGKSHKLEVRSMEDSRGSYSVIGKPMRQSQLVNVAVNYATEINSRIAEQMGVELGELKPSEMVCTVYLGEFEGSGSSSYPHSTLGSLRRKTWEVCRSMDNSHWQITSPIFDPHLHVLFNKPRLVKWGAEHDIPLEKTVSCYSPNEGKHCGVCQSCGQRKYAFAKAGVTDRTEYSNNVAYSVVLGAENAN